MMTFFRVCFQVPALTLEYGVTIVVSPLLGKPPSASCVSPADTSKALMKDQVAGLLAKGIKATMLFEKTDDATNKYVRAIPAAALTSLHWLIPVQ